MSTWLAWLTLAIVLGAAELLTLTAALGLLGAAALVTAGAAALGLPFPGQLLVFALTAVAGLILLWPVALRHMLRRSAFGAETLVGRTGNVTREVSAAGGVVRIDGEDWSARPLDDAVPILPGAAVDVLFIDGTTAVVNPQECSWS